MAKKVEATHIQEVYFGFVAPVGVDLNAFMDSFKKSLEIFDYDVCTISLSDYIKAKNQSKFKKKMSRIDELNLKIKLGDQLRSSTGSADILAQYGLAAIHELRERTEKTKPKPRKIAYLIKQIKRKEEAQLFSKTYSGTFFLCGVNNLEQERIRCLSKGNEVFNPAIEELFDLDRGRGSKMGKHFSQDMRNCYENSDIFFNEDDSYEKIERFLKLIHMDPSVTPSKEEHHMFLAFSAGLRSADLSRQVGAAIESVEGRIISLGANDVPSAGGGQYWAGKNDNRDYVWRYDSNFKEIERIRSNLSRFLSELDTMAEKKVGSIEEHFNKSIVDSGLLSLIEFGRPVHAEMDSIISSARLGIKIQGSVMYCTTFPCHNCAKHIVGSGVSAVIYIEEYSKSLALSLHRDSISHSKTRSDASSTTQFIPFSGIAPRRFLDLFSVSNSSGRDMVKKEKNKIDLKIVAPKDSHLRFANNINAYRTIEKAYMGLIQSIDVSEYILECLIKINPNLKAREKKKIEKKKPVDAAYKFDTLLSSAHRKKKKVEKRKMA